MFIYVFIQPVRDERNCTKIGGIILRAITEYFNYYILTLIQYSEYYKIKLNRSDIIIQLSTKLCLPVNWALMDSTTPVKDQKMTVTISRYQKITKKGLKGYLTTSNINYFQKITLKMHKKMTQKYSDKMNLPTVIPEWDPGYFSEKSLEIY